MKINVIYKIILITLILVNLFSICSNVQADMLSDIIGGADNFIETGKKNPNSVSTINDVNLKSVSNTIYNSLLTIAIVAAVIISAVLGIQFITGSIEAKAKVKESLIPFGVSCVVAFGAFGIWKLAVILLSEL